MTPRQRLLAVLAGQPVDQTPVWLLFPYHPTSYYVDVRRHPAYRAIHERSLGRAVILNRRNLTAPLLVPGAADRWAERRLDSDESLAAFAAARFETSGPLLAAALDQQLERYLQERREFPLDYGAMMLDLGEPIGVLYHRARLENFAIWSLTHDELVTDILDRLMERCRAIYRYCLERDLADVYFMVGSELAAPPLVSRATFRRWVAPYARELIDLVHTFGKQVIQHFHGQLRDLLPDFVEMGADGLHTIEAPPVGNCTLAQAFAAVQDRITLIGNIQYDDFRAFTPDQMRQAVGDLIHECRGKRFILSPTAGPYDPDPPPRMIENYRAFLDAALEAQG